MGRLEAQTAPTHPRAKSEPLGARSGLRSPAQAAPKLRAFLFQHQVAAGTLCFIMTEKIHWVDAVYLAFVSLATVGYGDVAPASDEATLAANAA